MKWTIPAAVVLAMSSVALAAEPEAQPILPHEMVWAGVMVQIVIGLFIAAAAIGPLVAILMPPSHEPMPEEEDDANQHDH